MKRNLQAIAITSVLLTATLSAADKITYEDDILPIFRNKCLKCHNADKMKADLDLSTYDAMMNGSGNGPVLAGGDPDESILYKAVAHLAKPTMPPKDKLPEKEIEIIKKWVEGGLLMNLGSKAVIAAKPKVSLSLDPGSLGKRPEGPAPMPTDAFALDPYVRTARTGVSTAMAVSPWSPLIAIGGQRQVLLYDTDTLLVAGIIPFDEGFPHSLKFSANGKNLIIGGGRGANLGISTVWDITKGERLMTVGDDLDAVLASDLSPDQRFIAHGGPDRFLRIFSTETGELVHKIKKHTDWVTAVRFSTDGKYVASGDRNGGLHIWETEPGQRICSFAHSTRVTGLEWATTNVVVSASMDGSAKIFNVDQARQLRSWSTHGGGAVSLARAMNGQLVTSGRNKRATLWNANGGKIRDFVFPGDIPAQAVPSHDGKRVIGSDWNGVVYVWNAADGKEIKRLSLNPEPMAEKFAAAQKVLAEKHKAATAAAAALKAMSDNATDAKKKLAVLDKVVTDAAAAKGAADKAMAALTAAVKKAQETFAAADKAAKADAKNADKQRASVAAKAALDKLSAEQKSAQAKAAAAAQAAKEAYQKGLLQSAEIAKQLKSAGPAQTTLNAANAALAAAQKEANGLEVGKVYSDYFNARKTLAEKKAVHAMVAAAAKVATDATVAAQTTLEAAKKTDIAAVKTQRTEVVKQAQANQAATETELATAKAEVAKEQVKVDAATKAIATAETAHKTALATVEKAKTDSSKAAVAAKDARAKATAAKATYDQLVIAKRGPAQAIMAALAKAQAQTAAARANTGKALAAINAEVGAANTIFQSAAKSAKTAEGIAATAKAAMDKYTADLAKQKTDLAAKQKTQATAKAEYEGLIAKKQKPAEAKLAAMTKVATQAPIDKAAADKALAGVNAEVKAALMVYLAAETAAQTAEAAAAKDQKQKPAAAAQRKTADNAKAVLDKLTAEKQKATRAAVAKTAAAAIAAPVNQANAAKELTAVKAEVAKAAAAHKAAVTTTTAAQTVVNTTTTNLAKSQADYKTKAGAATSKRNASNASKAVLDKVIAEKQKPAQAAQTAQATTATELAAAKAAGDKVVARVNTELAEAAKPVAIADTAAKTVEATAKTAAENVTKQTAIATTAKALIDTRKTETATAQAAMAKMVDEKQKPVETKLAGMKTAVTTAQAAHANVEKNHTAHMQQLTATIDIQGKTAEAKTAEATKLADELAAAQKQVDTLKATYEKLKTTSTSKPTKTAAK